MNTYPINTCIRCGTPRIVAKTWREGNITYSNFVCPDKSCQKIVESELKKKKDRLDIIKANSLKRRTENTRNRKKTLKLKNR